MSQVFTHQSSAVVAAFDFDGTLTYQDSMLPFLKFAVGPIKFYSGLVLLSPILIGLVLRVLPNWWVKSIVLRYFLGGWPVAKLQRVGEAFATQKLPQLLRPEALKRLAWHQHQGHKLVLISASLETYLRPWAASVPFDQVIGTRLEQHSDLITGRFAGENCYGPEKVKRLTTVLGDLTQYELHAYGDSKGDRELLAAAHSAYYRSFTTASTTIPSGNPSWKQGVIWSIIGATLLYALLVLWSGADQLKEALQKLPAWLIPVSLLIVFIGFCFRFFRWHWYLVSLGYQVPLMDSFRIFFAGFALSASPGRSGEAIRSILLKQRYKIPITETLSGLLCERLTDLLSVFILISFGILSIFQEGWSVFIFVALLTFILLGLQRPKLLKNLCIKPLRKWPRSQKIAQRIETIIDTSSLLLKPKILLISIFSGVLSWIFEGVALYLIFYFLGAHSINTYRSIMILAASDFIGAISFMPGGIGGSEVTIVSLAIFYGTSQSVAVASTLLIRFMTLWFGVWIGILAFLIEQKRT